MKNLISTILLVLIGFAKLHAQAPVYFRIVNDSPIIDIQSSADTSNLHIPIRLLFDTAGFKNEDIVLKDPDDETILLNDEPQKFGRDIKAAPGDTNYVIGLMVLGGKLVANISGNDPIKIPKEQIKLIIKGKDFLIHYKNDKPIPNPEDSDYVAGYIYYDAMAVASANVNRLTKLKILNYYKVDTLNPYLKELYKNLSGNQQVSNLVATAFSSLGNADVTYFAAGLARFLAERTKEELNEAFFNKMKEQLNAYPELKTAFPKTASFLDIIETYSYASVIQVLKESFETDIQNLPENLYNIKNLTRNNCDASLGKKLSDCQTRLDKLEAFFKTREGQWIGLGIFTVKEAVQSSNPYDLLSLVSESEELSGIKSSSKGKHFDDYNLASSIELANFISSSLKSKEENQIWISSKELNALFQDNDLKTLKIFLGLLLAKEQKGDVNIDFYNADGSATKTIGTILKEIHTKANIYDQVKGLIKNTYSAFNSANNAVKKIVAATEKSTEAEPQALYDYYRTFTASLKPIANSEILKTITGRTDIGNRYNLIEQFLSPSVDIAYHIATKKYSAALYDAVLLLNNTNNPVFEKPVAKSFIKYGTLISTVANAQSSDEVKNAIEASVLPVGSSAIKRKSAWSISVNGYVGGFYGMAHSSNTDTVRNSSTNKLDTITKKVSYRTFGLYAPVGVSFNRGFKCGWGVSLTAQILDLGALVDVYLTEGDQAALPTDFKVKISDILSPGAQLSINFPKMPLTLMGGIQYVPALSNKSQIVSDQNTLSPMAWRGQIALVVDIPMYNIKVWDFKE